MSYDLPSRLRELVPQSRKFMARAIVDAFSNVPWIIDSTKSGAVNLRDLNYSATDAQVGSYVVGEFLSYSLIYQVLAPLLHDDSRDSEESSTLEHCANFMNIIIEQDLGLKEPLMMFISEDIDIDIIDRLARLSPIGQNPEFLAEAGLDSTLSRAESDPTSIPGSRGCHFFRYMDFWDAPRCFLDQVPEVSGKFSDILAVAARRAVPGLATVDDSSDAIHVVVGMQVRDIAKPSRLVKDVIAKVIDEMLRNDEISDGVVDGCCRFISLAIDADKRLGGHLDRNIQGGLSIDFARIAVAVYRESDYFAEILQEVIHTS